MEVSGIIGEREIWVMQHPESRYGVAQRMGVEIARGLQATSHQLTAKVMSRGTDEYIHRLDQLMYSAHNPLSRFVVNQTIPDDIVYELYGVPHISYLLDAASHSSEILSDGHPRSAIIAFVDGDSVTFYEKRTGRRAHWIPHAIDADAIQRKLMSEGLFNIPYEERQIDLLISASWVDPEVELSFWKQYCSERTVDVLVEIAKKVLKEHSSHHLALLDQAMEEDTLLKKDLLQAFSQDLYRAFISLEKYIRGSDRVRFVHSLDRFSGAMTLLTHAEDIEKWKRSFSEALDLRILPDVPYEETWSVYAQSKCVLNSVPTIKRGAHERLIGALFCGAKVLSTPCTFLEEMPYVSDCSLHLGSVEKGQDVMDYLLEPYHRGREIQQWIHEHHTWKARFELLWPKLEESIHHIGQQRAHLFGI